MPGRARRPELGQHYLRHEVARRLVELSGVTARDLVLEIGAGRGALTACLATRAGRVLAVELDPVHAATLRDRFRGETGVEILESDFLALPLPVEVFTVVANIPYGDTARIVARVLESHAREAWLVVQREAAQRFAGHPWGVETRQSLLAKARWEVEVRGYPRRTDFDPPPSVDSAILHLRRRATPLVDARAFEAFLDQCFGRADTAARGLRARLSSLQVRRLAADLRFDERTRPSDLTFEPWLAAYRLTSREVL